MLYKTVFLIWVGYYFSMAFLLFTLFGTFINLYDDFFSYFNSIIYPEYWGNGEQDELENENELENELEKKNQEYKESPKYEDKYLEDIRKLDKEWVFTQEEHNEFSKLFADFYNLSIETRKNRMEEITKERVELEKQITDDIELINYVENFDEDGDELIQESSLEERNEYRREEIKRLQDELEKIKTEFLSEEGIIVLKEQTTEQAKKCIINKRLDKLSNCYVIEKTPIGNVLMIYDKDRETFKYYSDCNIPYRYLEVVGRKYVKLFHCRPIFVDMEEELRLFEEKWEKEQEIKKKKEEEKKRKADAVENQQQSVQTKKNVFAKFKSYNKDAGGKINMVAAPKNSIPNKSVSETKEDEKVSLKERTNRYTYEGKFANFNFLQKIERKVFNKKLGLSFADFKKMKK
jgi:hypothetical protein